MADQVSDVEEVSQGCVTAEWEQLRNAWVYLSISYVQNAFACVLYVCLWVIFYAYKGMPMCPPASENGMWSGLMLHFDCSSLACDLQLPSSDPHSQGQTVWSPSGQHG